MNNYPFSCMVDLLLNCVHKWLMGADISGILYQRERPAEGRKTMMTKPMGNETRREWTATGGTRVVAVRNHDGLWRVDAGPRNLVGRTFRHIRDLRIAANLAPLT